VATYLIFFPAQNVKKSCVLPLLQVGDDASWGECFLHSDVQPDWNSCWNSTAPNLWSELLYVCYNQCHFFV